MSDIFANRDPRLYASVILPNTEWGDKTIVIQGGIRASKEQSGNIWKTNGKYTFNGTDYYGMGHQDEKEVSGWTLDHFNGTITGFLLKKYLTGKNDQVWDQVTTPFVDLRYAEVLMNYAEAVAEGAAYGVTNGQGIMPAVDALNAVHKRAGFLDAMALTPENVRYERRAEFALEYYAIWDYIRRREIHVFFDNTHRRQALIPMLDFTSGAKKYIFVRAESQDANIIFEPKTYYRSIPGRGGNGVIQNPNY